MSLERHCLQKRTAEVERSEYVSLGGFASFGETPGDVLQSLSYSSAFSESFSKNFLRFVLSTYESRKALKEEPNQTLWSPIASVGTERREKRKLSAG